MFAKAYSGFPVELSGVGELHAAFLNESRTRGCSWRPVQEIRIHGPKTDSFKCFHSMREDSCSWQRYAGANIDWIPVQGRGPRSLLVAPPMNRNPRPQDQFLCQKRVTRCAERALDQSKQPGERAQALLTIRQRRESRPQNPAPKD